MTPNSDRVLQAIYTMKCEQIQIAWLNEIKISLKLCTGKSFRIFKAIYIFDTIIAADLVQLYGGLTSVGMIKITLGMGNKSPGQYEDCQKNSQHG